MAGDSPDASGRGCDMTDTTVTAGPPQTTVVYRHTVLTRITHWVNVVCITFLILSADCRSSTPTRRSISGQASDFDDPVLTMTARLGEDGQPIGETKIFGATFNTTGFLGVSDHRRRDRRRAASRHG